jgi:hypothetical protein
MRDFKLTKVQDIINRVNSKQDFIIDIEGGCDGRYVVGVKNLYKGSNPSIEPYLQLLVRNELKEGMHDCIGGWMDKDTNTYYLDSNFKVEQLGTALKIAKDNNQKDIYDTVLGLVIEVND